MWKTRRVFKSKGWYGTGEDEGFDPIFDVEIIREMGYDSVYHWDYGFVMEGGPRTITLFERNTMKISRSKDEWSTEYELETYDTITKERKKYKLVAVE